MVLIEFIDNLELILILLDHPVYLCVVYYYNRI